MQRNAVFYAQSIKVVSNSFAILWTVACQGPLSMGFSKQEFWSGLPFPPPGIFPTHGLSLSQAVSCAGRQILYHCTTWEAL